MLVKEAIEFGKISTGNTKMPGTTYAIDAFACNVGSKLRKVKGSTCASCYAIKLQKLRPSVDKGYKNNLAKFQRADLKQWVNAMVFQLERYNVDGHHRWFDSGDLQSVAMLRAIVLTAERTPEIKHWLPTREAKLVKLYRKEYGQEPSNLVIRVSATMIGDKPIAGHANTSTVHRKGETIHGKACLAYRTNKNSEVIEEQAFKDMTREQKKEQDFGHCGDCRACWSKTVDNISYPLH